MTTKTETGKTQTVNTLLLAIATLILLGGVGAYYYFQDEVITPVRVVGLLALAGLAAYVAGLSDSGATLFRFLKESDVERRKVVWPTHQETMQTALMVIIVTLLISLFLAGVDWLLGAIVRSLVSGA